MEDNEIMIEESENTEQPAELVDGNSTDDSQVQSQEPAQENGKVEGKLYTDEDFEKEVNKRLDDILPKKLSRREQKLKNEFKNKYGEIESYFKAGIGSDNLDEAVEKAREFYSSNNINIPKHEVSYSPKETEILAKAEAKEIIEIGYDEIVSELDNLSSKKDLSAKDKIIFNALFQEKNIIENKKELLKSGVKSEILENKEFQEFSKLFDKSVSISKVYEMYNKQSSKNAESSSIEPIGDLTNKDSKEEKKYYSDEEINKMSKSELKDPNTLKKVMDSLLNK